MTVRYRQTVDGEVLDERAIEPHFDGQTDAQLLAAKRKGAREKGWTIKQSGKTSFTATKDRWGGSICVRDFWTD